MTILGLDISTKTIGYSVLTFNQNDFEVNLCSYKELKLSKKLYNDFDLETFNKFFLKYNLFKEVLMDIKEKYKIDIISIEEPLFSSNNSLTSSLLLRFNGMISAIVFEIFNIIPTYTSSYQLRKNALPSLMQVSKYKKDGKDRSEKEIKRSQNKDEKVLFGSYKDKTDKKKILFEECYLLYKDKLTPPIINKQGNIAEGNYDAIDSFICALGLFNIIKK